MSARCTYVHNSTTRVLDMLLPVTSYPFQSSTLPSTQTHQRHLKLTKLLRHPAPSSSSSAVIDEGDARGVKVADEVVVETDRLHVRAHHVDALVDGVRIDAVAVAGRDPAIDVVGEV